MKNGARLMLIALLAMALLAGCAGGGGQSASYKDGTYEGRSEVYEGDEEGNGDGYGVVSVTIKDGAIAGCEFTTYETDGAPKDGEYGKMRGEIANKDFYNKAQKAVQACPVYAARLVETGDLSRVDAISGATYNYQQFQDAVRDALSRAKE